MTSERETIKILVVGILQGNNRGNWVAELLTRWDHKFCFDFRYSPLRVRPRQHLWSRIHQALLCVFAGLVDILQGLRAEIIYVPPKSYPYLKYGVALKRILEAKLLVDPYVFTLSTLEETGGEDCWMGNRAQCPEYDRLSPLKSDVILHPSATEVKLAAELSNVEAPLGKVVILPLAMEKRSPASRRPVTEKFRVVWWGHFTTLHGVERVLCALQFLKCKKECDFLRWRPA